MGLLFESLGVRDDGVSFPTLQAGRTATYEAERQERERQKRMEEVRPLLRKSLRRPGSYGGSAD